MSEKANDSGQWTRRNRLRVLLHTPRFYPNRGVILLVAADRFGARFELEVFGVSLVRATFLRLEAIDVDSRVTFGLLGFWVEVVWLSQSGARQSG